MQRAVLRNDNDPNSLIHTLKALKDALIMAYAGDDDAVGKVAGFNGQESVTEALNVIRQNTPAYNLSDVAAAFANRFGGQVNAQTAQTLANALGPDTLARANLNADQMSLLDSNMELSGHIVTDRERAAIRRQAQIDLAIRGLRDQFGNYADTFRHIFSGDFKQRNNHPTGYHSKAGNSDTHEAYGGKTDLGAHGTYQQSVREKQNHRNKKPLQSTFFPDNATEDEVKIAVVSGDTRHNKTVQYPDKLAGMPLAKSGTTIFPATGQDKNAE